MGSRSPDAADHDVDEFVRRYFADQDAGHDYDLEHYLALFPDSREAVAQAWNVLDDSAPERIGSYRLTRPLGSGGQGDVFLAVDERLGREVALKRLSVFQPLSREAIGRFRREAEVTSRLDHPSICPVYEMDWHEGQPYIVMPYIEGETLASAIKRAKSRGQAEVAGESPMDVDRILRAIELTARALHVAHEAGVVHRDVKPGNIIVRPDGEPVVLDFGVAAVLEGEGAVLTRTGELVGTLPYMAPEQLDPTRGAISGRTDVFSLAVCLYEALTLTHPFIQGTFERTWKAILDLDPEDVRSTGTKAPRDLSVVLSTALQKDPRHRYRTAEDFAEDLRRVREREPIRTRPAGPLLRFQRWTQRKPALAAAVLGLFATLFAGLVTTGLLLRGTSRALDREAEALNALEVEQWDRQLTLDSLLVSELPGRVDELWPATPARVRDPDGLDAWLEQAERLVLALSQRRATLAEVEARALPLSSEDQARERRRREDLRGRILQMERLRDDPPFPEGPMIERSRSVAEQAIRDLQASLERREAWTFTDPDDGRRRIALRRIVDETPQLEPLVTVVRARRTVALEVRERSVDAHAPRWQQAIEEVSRDERFVGSGLTPQTGLVPLGRDPGSGLQEFAHLPTGAVPDRDPDSGRLRIHDGTGLVFVLLPGVEATIGARRPDPQHPLGTPHVDPYAPSSMEPRSVRLDPFLISKYEMTQGQWRRVTGQRPSGLGVGRRAGGSQAITERHPVERVSWVNAATWMRRLELGLPTDAQWEYAARGGTVTVWWTGDEKESLRGAVNIADRTSARFPHLASWDHQVWLDDGWLTHAPVGTFRANPFGLHEMLGNVKEWCRDGMVKLATRERRPGDGLQMGTYPLARVTRGSAFDSTHLDARSSRTKLSTATHLADGIGLRPVCPLREDR